MPQKSLGTQDFGYSSEVTKKKKKSIHPLGHVTLPALEADLIRALRGASEICGGFSLQMQEESRWMDK